MYRPPIPKPSPAFTLLELMGTLAILALVLAVAGTATLHRVRERQRDAEAAELSRIASAWVLAVLESRTIPGATHWADLLATAGAVTPGQAARNGSGNPRLLVFDPAARFGLPTLPPPYTQTAEGSPEPLHPRLVLVSSLTDPLPNLDGMAFDALWSRLPGQRPAGWPTTWSGDPSDLLIERVDLRGRFHRILLENTDPEVAAPYAVLTGEATVPPGGTRDAWFLEGSVLYLRTADGGWQTAHRIAGDVSFVFERGHWAHSILDGPSRRLGLGGLADRFLLSPGPVDHARAAVDQSAVVDEAVHYLTASAQWRLGGMPTSTPPGSDPLQRAVIEAQSRLQNAASRLVAP